jgi:hypothetical protein
MTISTRSASVLASVSLVALMTEILSRFSASNVDDIGSELSSLAETALKEQAREAAINRVLSTRLKALAVDFFRSKKNAGLPSEAVAKFLASKYVQQYHAGESGEFLLAMLDRVSSWMDDNTGSAKRDSSNAKKGMITDTVNTAFFVSRGPSGVSLNKTHYETMWSSTSCVAYQQLQLELAAINNPADDSEEEAEEELGSFDPEAELASEESASDDSADSEVLG